MGKQYDAEKHDGFHGNQHTIPVRSADAQNEHQQTSEKTCERIARENHISASAVRRAALFAAGVDLAEELCPGIRQRVLSGDLKVPSALFERLAKARPEEYDVILEQIKNPQSRSKPAAKQKLFQAKKSASSEPILAPHQGESKSVPEEPGASFGAHPILLSYRIDCLYNPTMKYTIWAISGGIV